MSLPSIPSTVIGSIIGDDLIIPAKDIKSTQSSGYIAVGRKVICEFDIQGNSSIPTTETLVTLSLKTGTSCYIPANSLLPSVNKPQFLVNLRCGVNHRYSSGGLTIRLRAGSDPTLANNTVVMLWYIDLRRVGGLRNNKQCSGWHCC